MPTVVVASDAFKGSLTSLEVADAVRLGLLDVAPDARVVVVPVADGGEGTVAAALASGWRRRAGRRCTARPASRWPRRCRSPRPGRHRAVTVLVEMADACGLGRLPDGVPAPLTASSRGLGEAVRAALDLGAAEVVVGRRRVGQHRRWRGRCSPRSVPACSTPTVATCRTVGPPWPTWPSSTSSGLDPRLAHHPPRARRRRRQPAARPDRRGGGVRPAEGRHPGEVAALEAP